MSSQRYPTKDLRYKICEFFEELQVDSTGLGPQLHVSLVDMESLLEFAVGSDEDAKIEALWSELLALNEERFGDAMNRPVISIINLPVPEDLEDFHTNFISGGILDVRCSSKNLEDYMTELKIRTLAAIQAQRYGGRLGLERLPDGRVKIIFGEKEMTVNKTKKLVFDLRISMVLLMFGETIDLTDDRSVSITDYNKGDHITYNKLLSPLRIIEGVERMDDPSSIDLKSIKDAARGIRNASLKKLGLSIFDTNDEGMKLVL